MRDFSIVTAKVEPVYGTDSGPTVLANALRVFNWTPRGAIYDDVRRKIERHFHGATPKGKANGRQGHAFQFELCGSGAADTPTSWGEVWLRAMLFGAPVPAVGVDVTYPLVSTDDGSSVSFAGYKASERYRTEGFRASGKLIFPANDYPYGEVDGMGLLNNLPDSSAPGAPVYAAYPAPVLFNDENSTVMLGGFATRTQSVEFDLGNKVGYKSLVGQRAVLFEKADDGDGRAMRVTIVIEKPDPATKAYWADVDNRTDVPISVVHGTDPGNIVDVSSNYLQLDEPAYSVAQGVQMMTLTGDLVPPTGGAELVLKTR